MVSSVNAIPFLLRLDQHVFSFIKFYPRILAFRRFRDILYKRFKWLKETDDQIGG